MAAEAETLLADTGWLPEPLRTCKGGVSNTPSASEPGDATETADVGVEAAADGHETVMGETELQTEDASAAADAPRDRGRVAAATNTPLGPPATAGFLFVSEDKMQKKPPNWRTASCANPRRCAVTTSPMAAAKGATGWWAICATHRAA